MDGIDPLHDNRAKARARARLWMSKPFSGIDGKLSIRLLADREQPDLEIVQIRKLEVSCVLSVTRWVRLQPAIGMERTGS